MKQGYIGVRKAIAGGHGICLVQVARLAGEGQITRCVIASLGAGMDVLHFEGEVEDLFGRAAILAPLSGPRRDLRITWIHDFTCWRD